jgi:hypothetical protein
LKLLWSAESSSFAEIALLTLVAGITLSAALLAASHTRGQLRGCLYHYSTKWKSVNGH